MLESKKVQATLKKIARTAPPNEQKRIKKQCFACGNHFTCSTQASYDYCRSCSLNNSRYIPRQSKCAEQSPGYFNKCPECGDGSGVVKFPYQPLRQCKLCFLINQANREEQNFAS